MIMNCHIEPKWLPTKAYDISYSLPFFSPTDEPNGKTPADKNKELNHEFCSFIKLSNSSSVDSGILNATSS